MSKRAGSKEFWVVAVAILTVVSLLLLIPLFGETKKLGEDLTDYRICKDGNRITVQTRFKPLDWVVAEQGVRHCKTERVKVPSGKEYETIAKKMALCWDQYLEGKEELFETKDANYCAFCSVLEFEDKNKKLNELTRYLSNNKLPSGQTYIQYLSEIEVTRNDINQLENLELKNNVFVDTSKKLAVLFVMYKDAYPGAIGEPRAKLAFFGGGALGVAGVGLGVYLLGSAALCLIPLTSLIGCAASISLVTIGTGAGALTGYLIGSDRSADWRARILVTEYDKQKLEQLKCTQLEGLDYLIVQGK